MNGNGYIETAPFQSAVTARLAGSHDDALTVPHVQLAAGSIVTAFAIGGKTGTYVNPLRVLLCNDNAPSVALMTQCIVTP